MPLSLLVASVLFSIQTQEPQLQQKLTLRFNAGGLVTFTNTLMKATGVKMEADAILERQNVLVNVKDVTLSDLMAKIADVTDTEWTVVNGAQHLQVSKEKRKRQEEKEASEQAVIVQSTLAKYQTLASGEYKAKDLANYVHEQLSRTARDRGDFDPSAVQQWLGPQAEHMGMAPTGRSFARALLSIDPTEIARVRVDERVVYSTNPTAKQKRLNLDLSKERGLIVADTKVFQEAIKLANLSKEEEANIGRWSNNDPELAQAFQPAKAVLVISRSEMFGSTVIMAEYQVFNKDGDVVDSHQTALWAGMEAFALFTGDMDLTPESKLPAREDSLWHRSYLFGRSGMGNEGDQPAPKTPDLRVESIIKHPNKMEPLSFYTSDLIVLCAEAIGKNLVAELGDSAILLGYIKLEDSAQLAKFVPRLEKTLLTNISNDDKWCLWRAKRPMEDRNQVIDRNALTDFVMDRKQVSNTQLERSAIYAWNRKSAASMNMVEMIYIQSTSTQNNMGSFGGGEFSDPALMFLGSLDQNTRTSLFNGVSLTYGRLADTQRRLLERLVYGVTGSKSINSFGNLWDKSSKANEDELGDYPRITEPTELLPTGIPAAATVQLNHVDTPQIYTAGPNGSGWIPTDPSTIAWAIAVQKRPELARGGEKIPVPTVFRLGSLRTFRLIFWVAPKIYFGYSSNEPGAAMSPQDLMLAQLPGDIQKQIQETLKEYMDSKFDEEGGGVAVPASAPGTTGGGGSGAQ